MASNIIFKKKRWQWHETLERPVNTIVLHHESEDTNGWRTNILYVLKRRRWKRQNRYFSLILELYPVTSRRNLQRQKAIAAETASEIIEFDSKKLPQSWTVEFHPKLVDFISKNNKTIRQSLSNHSSHWCRLMMNLVDLVSFSLSFATRKSHFELLWERVTLRRRCSKNCRRVAAEIPVDDGNFLPPNFCANFADWWPVTCL